MNHSFKFIVNPNKTENIEITSLLQYYALKNIFSEFTSNNNKSFYYNNKKVYFSNEIYKIYPNASFTEYIQMTRSEKDAFKTKCVKDTNASSLFSDAISEIEYTGSFKDLRPLEYTKIAPDNYTVNDLCTVFMHYEYAKKYLSKYIPKNSEEVCYIRIPKTDWENFIIIYDDNFIWFNPLDRDFTIDSFKEEYHRFINCIKECVEIQILKNNGRIENTCDELCVYTEDSDIIYKVLTNNQVIIDTMVKYIFYINYRVHTNYFYKYDVFNELQTSITDVVNTYESIEKKTKDNLTVLNDLFN